jgi:ATP-dependent 26S proteasome regulatory subunit
VVEGRPAAGGDRRLDPAILDRPSRFDRKYYFPLPGPDERRRFLAASNGSLEADMRLSEAGVEAAVAATEGFSFAYLKELLLSAAMEWIHDPVRGRMDDLLARRAASLLEQMRTEPQEEAGEEDEEE